MTIASPHADERTPALDAISPYLPRSWEADLAQQLVNGTPGWEDDLLHQYGEHVS